MASSILHETFCDVIVLCMYIACLCQLANGRARLIEPTMRSSLWRLGEIDVPMNYLDELLNCGGFYEQWQRAGGRCGACGDAYNDVVKQNEYPGVYSNQAPIKTIYTGQKLNVTVYTRQNMLGYFEFRLCPQQEGPIGPDLESCFKSSGPLIIDETNSTRYFTGSGREYYDMHLRMPEGLTCDICVLQWKYHTGYRHGRDSPRCAECLGCGPQEEYINCADIRVLGSPASSKINGDTDNGNDVTRPTNNNISKPKVEYTYPSAGSGFFIAGNRNVPPENLQTSTSVKTTSTTRRPATTVVTTSTITTTASTTVSKVTTEMSTVPSSTTTKEPCTPTFKNVVCGPSVPQKNVKGMTAWCRQHCQAGSCPRQYCVCYCEYPDGSRTYLKKVFNGMDKPLTKQDFPVKAKCFVPMGQWKSNPGMNLWCKMNCPGGSCGLVCAQVVCV